MTGQGANLSAAALRQAFERSFAEAAETGADAFDDYLAIRAGGDPHALRLADVARIMPLRLLSRYPSAAAGWLGLAGVEGGVLPVYDLGRLMGYPAGPAPRWLAVGRSAVALAFDAFEGQFRVPREPEARASDAPGAGMAQLVQAPGGARPVVSVDALVATIRSLAPDSASQQEES